MITFTLVLVDIVLIGAIAFGLLTLVQNILGSMGKDKTKKKPPVGFIAGILHHESSANEVTDKKKVIK